MRNYCLLFKATLILDYTLHLLFSIFRILTFYVAIFIFNTKFDLNWKKSWFNSNYHLFMKETLQTSLFCLVDIILDLFLVCGDSFFADTTVYSTTLRRVSWLKNFTFDFLLTPRLVSLYLVFTMSLMFYFFLIKSPTYSVLIFLFFLIGNLESSDRVIWLQF